MCQNRCSRDQKQRQISRGCTVICEVAVPAVPQAGSSSMHLHLYMVPGDGAQLLLDKLMKAAVSFSHNPY